jgi:peptide/nickel transport system permease protein
MADAVELAPLPAKSRRRGAWKTLLRAPVSVKFSLLIVLAYLAAALFAPWIAPYGETELVSQEPFSPWSSENLLGTDQLGRDMLSRLIFGARNSIGIAMLTTLFAFAVGGTLGVTAALFRGWVDQLIARLVDVFMAIPQLIFALLLLSIFGTSVQNLIVIIALLDATRVFRLSRALAMNVVVNDYIEAAQLRGERMLWIIFQEIIPNIVATLAAEFGLRFCFVFLTISSLSFLGLGIQPPTADWGSMVRDNAALITYGDITPLLPAAAIATLTVAVNFVVDWYLHLSSGAKD